MDSPALNCAKLNFPWLDDTGLGGRVPVNIAEGTCSMMTQVTVDLASTHH